jgi:hypothetical protein
MQPTGFIDRGVALGSGVPSGALARFTAATALALALASAAVATVSADQPQDGPINTGASNGGIASASSGGNVSIGEIVTGENTGNSIVTGNITGSADIAGGDIDYPTDVNVTLNIGPPIASAEGGDYGTATGPSPDPPVYNVNIDNTDKNRNDNRSKATGIGEGGEGGQGGSGGDVIINGDTQPQE